MNEVARGILYVSNTFITAKMIKVLATSIGEKKAFSEITETKIM